MTSTWAQVKGGKGGGRQLQETVTDVGMQCGTQIRAAEDGGWRVQVTSRLAKFTLGEEVDSGCNTQISGYNYEQLLMGGR